MQVLIQGFNDPKTVPPKHNKDKNYPAKRHKK